MTLGERLGRGGDEDAGAEDDDRDADGHPDRAELRGGEQHAGERDDAAAGHDEAGERHLEGRHHPAPDEVVRLGVAGGVVGPGEHHPLHEHAHEHEGADHEHARC